MEGIRVKQEILEQQQELVIPTKRKKNVSDIPVIDIASSDDDDSSTSGNAVRNSAKKPRVPIDGKKSGEDVVLPDGFLDPLPPKSVTNESGVITQGSKQFWKAGDFEPGSGGNWETVSGGMDHVRVHPRFLHSNATSHKWVLGAFAELMDNSLDEVCNGATYVKIDMLRNKKDRNRMLVIEDNGGGMDPDKMRQCMSLGYSLKSKVADTIGQYGNGFKTSTMRLGADVIVFSRCNAKDGKSSTQSIGLLSYTFLRSTGKEDIVVPMKIIRSTPADWDTNQKAIGQWSPFTSEAELLKQFDQMKDQGTRIIIYNLWEDDQGQLELDFDEDENDIQIRGVNRDEKNIQMATNYPNSRHFLTYRHSLRSYASILYLRIPAGFRMILRGKDVEHHNIVNDMMMTTEITYRPQPGADGVSKDSNIVAVVTMGFVKDAKSHIDVQGYNVYHKNRLIKPFWRLWNAAGSAGRGVIGVLEANFVEPAHDKQGFERTIVLSRLESRLVQMQKTYWHTYCHRIGYAPRANKNSPDDLESSPDPYPETSSKKKKAASTTPVATTPSNKFSSNHKLPAVNGEGPNSLKSTPLTENNNNIRDDDLQTPVNTNGNSYKGISTKKSTPKSGYSHSVRSNQHEAGQGYYPVGNAMEILPHAEPQGVGEKGSASLCSDLSQLVEENSQLKEKLQRKEEDVLGDLLHDLQIEKNCCKELEAQIEEAKEKCESLNREQESVIDIFADERQRRDVEEQSLRKKLKDATAKIQDLVEQVKQLESEKVKFQKMERG